MLKLSLAQGKTSYFRSVAHDVATASSRHVAFADEAIRDGLIMQLTALHSMRSIKHISLDVFDTVVLRNNKAESRRFWEIAGRIADAVGRSGKALRQEDVFVARIMATRASYRTRQPVKHCREGSLTSIYRGICESLGVPEMEAQAIDIEIQYEIENTSRNPLIDEIIAFANSQGCAISMISDMYMHAPQIARIVHHHFAEEALQLGQVVSSADESISKRSGHLFDLVAKERGLEPGDFVHIGDSVAGDYRSPIQRGWRALLIPHSRSEQVAIEEDHIRFVDELGKAGLNMGGWIKSGV